MGDLGVKSQLGGQGYTCIKQQPWLGAPCFPTESMKVLKNQPCEQCGTTRYRETAEGEMVCKYGHLLIGWRQEEGDEFVWTGRARNKTQAVQEANSNDADCEWEKVLACR